MSGHDRTRMGGDRGTFLTTHWSLIDGVKTEEDKDRALIGLLLERTVLGLFLANSPKIR